jgi:hypothetical protein
VGCRCATDRPANAALANGLGVSALDEPYDESHHSNFLPDDDSVFNSPFLVAAL